MQAGNGWEEQLCGMKSMALRGSGRPGRRDSIEEDSIFRFVWFGLAWLGKVWFGIISFMGNFGLIFG